jgi:kumamolisin
LRNAEGAQQRSSRLHALTTQPALARAHMTREDFAKDHGSGANDVEAVKLFASHHGLVVTQINRGTATVHLRGTLGAASAAFHTQVKRYRAGDVEYRARKTPISVPKELHGVVEAVLGFDTRPFVTPKFRKRATPAAGAGTTNAAAAASFTPLQIATAYQFPPGDGTGQVVGIIELGSPHGSGYRIAELNAFFQSLNIAPPQIVAVAVDGGSNKPGTNPNDPKNGDGEVMLDIEVIGSIVPKAKIVVYFAPNTAQGFVDVINNAIHDADNKPSVISLSWAGPEDPNDSSNDQIGQALEDAVTLGVTFCVASGDSGSRENAADPTHACVSFPSSHPNALGCGGTTLTVSANGSIKSEVVWQDCSGGGVSRVYPLPDYQTGIGVPAAVNPAGPVMRGVPDVSGNAENYMVWVDNLKQPEDGTSAVAPLWAALITRLNQKLGRPVGFVNPALYAHAAAFRDIVEGSNIDYNATKGWDACTGLGSPNGEALLAALGGPAAAAATAKKK